MQNGYNSGITDFSARTDIDFYPDSHQCIKFGAQTIRKVPIQSIYPYILIRPQLQQKFHASLNSKQRSQVRSDESGQYYSLQDDKNGDYSSWTPPVGTYTLTAGTYSGANGSGTPGGQKTITFSVIDNANQGTRIARAGTMVEEEIKIYPNPFKDALTLELPSGLGTESALVTITTIEGKIVYQKEVKVNNDKFMEEFHGFSKLPSGMYLFMLQIDDKPIVLKVMKQ